MDEIVGALPNPYTVKSGDTLLNISKACGQRLSDLVRWNGIINVGRIKEGQVLFLTESSAFGFIVLFLDALRSPIKNIPYQLRFDERTVNGVSDEAGKTLECVTKNASSVVTVWVRNLEQQWQETASFVSGLGVKLIVLISAQVGVKSQTDFLPERVPVVPSNSRERGSGSGLDDPPSSQAKNPVPPAGDSSKNNPAVKTAKDKGPEGQSVIKVGVQVPDGLIEHFSKYKSGEIAADDWKRVADELECDVAVLKGFAEVESGGKSSFWRLNSGNGASVPALLYERHYFSRLTSRQYDTNHPDVSWRYGYKKKSQLGLESERMPLGVVKERDVYGDFASAYLRLLRAYSLDAGAALRACSWGKFQIMGDNYALCGVSSVVRFVDMVCESELKQIELVAGFIRNKPRSWIDAKNKNLGREISLWSAVKQKNWAAMAFNYNGPDYKNYAYDEKLRAAFERNGGS